MRKNGGFEAFINDGVEWIGSRATKQKESDYQRSKGNMTFGGEMDEMEHYLVFGLIGMT